MDTEKPSALRASIALFFAIAAVAGVGYAYIEPIIAYEKMLAGTYDFPSSLAAALAAGRLQEAMWPLIGGTVACLLGLGLGALVKSPKGLKMATLGLSTVALLGAGYIWGMHGSGIVGADGKLGHQCSADADCEAPLGCLTLKFAPYEKGCGAVNTLVLRAEELADEQCACNNKACAREVVDKFRKLMDEVGDATVNPDELARFKAANVEARACFEKL
jgi:hypothetical protein